MIDCLTDGTPVHMILPQFPESSPEDVISSSDIGPLLYHCYKKTVMPESAIAIIV